MTELLWDGKYDKSGRKTAQLRVALPCYEMEQATSRLPGLQANGGRPEHSSTARAAR